LIGGVDPSSTATFNRGSRRVPGPSGMYREFEGDSATNGAEPRRYNRRLMQPSRFDELAFFRELHRSGARALLIGRRALVLLGLPVLTADYDFWIATDDIARFNSVAERFELRPTKTADEARQSGRYVLENDEHVDVLVARAFSTADGQSVAFDTLWAHRQSVTLDNVAVAIPSIDDLILTKQVSTRPKDLEDIRLLRMLKEGPS